MTLLVAATAETPVAPASVPQLSPVTVLMYHNVVDQSTGSKFAIPISLFKEQMQYLVDHGYHTILSENYVRFLKGEAQLPEKSVVITFDDWKPGQYDLARPILNRLGLHAIFFVITEKVRTPSERAKLQTLLAEGHEIGSHTVHHYYLGQEPCNAKWKCCQQLQPCTEAQIRSEIVQSHQDLAAILGTAPLSIAWPGNFFDDKMITLALEDGYLGSYAVELQTMEDGVLTNRVGITQNPRVIYRTEIGGQCEMQYFAKAVTSQRCCIVSARKFYRHCTPQEP